MLDDLQTGENVKPKRRCPFDPVITDIDDSRQIRLAVEVDGVSRGELPPRRDRSVKGADIDQRIPRCRLQPFANDAVVVQVRPLLPVAHGDSTPGKIVRSPSNTVSKSRNSAVDGDGS